MDASKIRISYGNIYTPKFIEENLEIFDPRKGMGFHPEKNVLSIFHQGNGVDIHLNTVFMDGYGAAQGDMEVLGCELEKKVRQELSDSMHNLEALMVFVRSGKLQDNFYFTVDTRGYNFFDYWQESPKLSADFLEVVDRTKTKIMNPKYLDIVSLRKNMHVPSNGNIPAFRGSSLKDAIDGALNFYNRKEEVREFVRLAT